MQREFAEPVPALVKRSAWLAARISFWVLAPISIVCLLVTSGLLAYKCGASGMSPISFFRAVDKAILAKIASGLIASMMLTVLGVGMCTLTGALIGAVAAGYYKFRDRLMRQNLQS
jgi:hypothetical protein